MTFSIPHIDAVSETGAIVYRHFFLPHSSSSSRFTAGASEFFILSQTGDRILPLRDDAFEAQLAGVPKHGLAVVFHVLVEPDAGPSLGQGPSEAFGESPTQ